MKEKFELPKLDNNQCSVTFAELNAGILLTPDGERYVGKVKYYRTFDSEAEASAFAKEYVKHNPLVECSIRDKDGRHIKMVVYEKGAVYGNKSEDQIRTEDNQ